MRPIYMIAPCKVYKVMRRNLQPTKPETPGQTPSLNYKCTGFFYQHYTTHGTYSFTSHPKNEAIMVKCLAQGHKCRYRESNPHSGFLTTPTVLNDYRPVALTAVIMKCFERIVKELLVSQTKPFIDPFQFAYRAERSVEDAILTLLHSIYSHLEQSKA